MSQSESIVHATRAAHKAAAAPTASASTRYMLISGAVAGPLFIIAVLVQDYTRPGFDPRVHMLSLLALGPLGWIQVANFVLVGLLNLAYSVGLRRELRDSNGGTASAILIGAYGLGLVTVGIFRTDPSDGFPPGVATVKPPSPHGFVHGFGALVVFVTLSAALLCLSRALNARRDRAGSVYAFSSAVAMLSVFVAGFVWPTATARLLRLAVLIGWSAVSLVALRLLGIWKNHSFAGPIPLRLFKAL